MRRGKKRAIIALLMGRQAQTMVTWHSIVDQWLTGASWTGEVSLSHARCLNEDDALTCRVMGPFVLIHDDDSKNTNDGQPAIESARMRWKVSPDGTYTRPVANMRATPSFFRADKFSFRTS